MNLLFVFSSFSAEENSSSDNDQNGWNSNNNTDNSSLRFVLIIGLDRQGAAS
jgi:hypothetical protein